MLRLFFACTIRALSRGLTAIGQYSVVTSMDIQQYLHRIGYHGSHTPNAELLSAITAAHAAAIPFENIDVLLKRDISLDSHDVFRKLVGQQRGGYCFEQNGLLLAALTALGFAAQPLGGRVRLGVTDRDIFPRRTHLFIKVRIEDEYYLTDVGFGAQSLTQALRWQEGTVQHTPHDTRRLVREGERWFQQLLMHDEWVDIFEFYDTPMHPSDQEVANWFTSTSPASHFTQRLSLALAPTTGERITIAGNVLRVRRGGDVLSEVNLTGANIAQMLQRYAGIHLSAAEAQELWANNRFLTQ